MLVDCWFAEGHRGHLIDNDICFTLLNGNTVKLSVWTIAHKSFFNSNQNNSFPFRVSFMKYSTLMDGRWSYICQIAKECYVCACACACMCVCGCVCLCVHVCVCWNHSVEKSTDVHHTSLLGLHHSMDTQKKIQIIEKWHEGVTSNTCMTTLMCNQGLSLCVVEDRLFFTALFCQLLHVYNVDILLMLLCHCFILLQSDFLNDEWTKSERISCIPQPDYFICVPFSLHPFHFHNDSKVSYHCLQFSRQCLPLVPLVLSCLSIDPCDSLNRSSCVRVICMICWITESIRTGCRRSVRIHLLSPSS